jgi:hypothetical protein
MQHLRARYYSGEMGRFLTKDNWQGDYFLPMSSNAWLYGYSNPVKYTDPTGMFPIYCHSMPSRIQFEDCVRKEYSLNRPREYDLAYYNQANDSPGCHYEVSPRYPVSYDAEGYLEGLGTLWFFALADQQEVVYDFAEMTSALFDIEGGQISDSMIGIQAYVYSGVIGFPYFTNTGFSNQKTIEEDYSGPSIYSPFGISLRTPAPLIPGPGIFVSGFKGMNLNPLGGVTVGIGLGYGSDPLLIFDMGVGISNATYRSRTKKDYTFLGGDGTLKFVNEGILRQDILSGAMSPWAGHGIMNSAINPVASMRLYALSQLERWVTIYQDLNNGE